MLHKRYFSIYIYRPRKRTLLVAQLSRRTNPSCPTFLQTTSKPVLLPQRRARGQEDEVGELDEVDEIDKVDAKAEINRRTLYIPQMKILEVLRLERIIMRNRPPLVLFV